jgi:hypothetical protein
MTSLKFEAPQTPALAIRPLGYILDESEISKRWQTAFGRFTPMTLAGLPTTHKTQIHSTNAEFEHRC